MMMTSLILSNVNERFKQEDKIHAEIEIAATKLGL
jgi:hypothetical protein